MRAFEVWDWGEGEGARAGWGFYGRHGELDDGDAMLFFFLLSAQKSLTPRSSLVVCFVLRLSRSAYYVGTAVQASIAPRSVRPGAKENNSVCRTPREKHAKASNSYTTYDGPRNHALAPPRVLCRAETKPRPVNAITM
jgi:hypothetical protein